MRSKSLMPWRGRSCFLLLLFFFSGISVLLHGQERPRIVSLAPALTELVCRLGQEKLLVGRSSACDEPPGIRHVPVVGAFGRPNAEAVIACKPTVIFANDFADPSVAELFRSAGIRVIRKQCRNLEDYLAWVELAGKVLSCEAETHAEKVRVCNELEQMKRLYPPESGKTVLCLIWDRPPMAAGHGSFPDALIRLAGLRNIAGGTKQEYFTPSMEWLLAHQADYILAPGFSKERIAELRRDRAWKGLRAVRENRIVSEIDPDLLLRPGPRLTEGVRRLAELCSETKGF